MRSHRSGPQDRIPRTDFRGAPAIRWVDRRDVYVRDHPVLMCLALAAALGGIAFLIVPDVMSRSALGVLPGGSERCWSVLLAAGGALVANGMWTLDARREVAGLLLLAGCYAAYAYAIFAFRGFAPGAASASVFAGLTAGFTLRAFILRFEPAWRPWARRRAR